MKIISMKDLGEASCILKIKIYRDRSKEMLDLSQQLYIENELKRFGIENSKRDLLPFKHGVHLSKKMYPSTSEKIQHMSKILYTSAIGSLVYAMLYTRLDISLNVCVMSRYQSKLREEYWIVVKNILKYLRRTKDLLLIFRRGDLQA